MAVADRATAGGLGRLPFIDGLRGIAASAVVVYHLSGNAALGSEPFANSLFAHIAHFGSLGVYVFFVISGFVITLSVGNGPINGSFFWRYALRRAVRLDPPYWISMIVAIGLAILAQRMIPSLHKELPTAGAILAHLFYVQNFLGYENIVAVYWTLCFEIQFYLTLLLVLWSSQLAATERTVSAAIRTPVFFIVSATLFVYSLGQLAGLWAPSIPGLFTHSWYAFCAGSACFITLQYRWPRIGFLLTVLLLAGVSIYFASPAGLATLLTALVVYFAVGRGHAQRWLAGPIAQYFGRISYSLYLLHPTIGWTTVSILKKIFGNATSVWMGIALIAAGFAASIVASHLAYLLIERPSIRLSHKIRLRAAQRAAAVAA